MLIIAYFLLFCHGKNIHYITVPKVSYIYIIHLNGGALTGYWLSYINIQFITRITAHFAHEQSLDLINVLHGSYYITVLTHDRSDCDTDFTFSHALPIVGIVVTISPSLNLYKMVVLPDASKPTMRIRISFFETRPRIRLMIFPILVLFQKLF